MKHFYSILVSIVLLASGSNAQISGIVFRDFNANGAKDNSATFNEPFISGIVVKVYNATNVLIATLTTSGTLAPNYSFPASGPNSVPAGNYRVELTGLSAVDYSSNAGNDNGTSVQFVTAPNANVDYAINAPEEFWDNTANPNPLLMVVHQKKGMSTNTVTGGGYTCLQIYNNSSGPIAPASSSTILPIDTTGVKRSAIHSQTGSLFGLAYQNKQEQFFTSALLKRHCGLGPEGAGGVYILNKSGVNFAYGSSFTLQGITPSNGGPALDFGSVTRVSSPTSNDNFLNNSANTRNNRDIDAFDKVGKMAYGGIEFQPGTDTLVMLNLFQRKLIKLNVAGAVFTPATLGPLVKAYDILSLPGCPVATGGEIRPYGLKIYKGKGYLGVVADASIVRTEANLKGYILEFDPNNIPAGFTTVITIDFSNYEGPVSATLYHPWASNWADAGGNGTVSGPIVYGQPMISDIEFNEDGSMDIGIRDRWGDQGGDFELNAVSGATATTQTQTRGDLLHACKVGSGWILEGMSGSCTQNFVGGDPASPTLSPVSWGYSYGVGVTDGGTGMEYYADAGGDGSSENSNGVLAKLKGSGVIVSGVYDPIANGVNGSSAYFSIQGIQWNSNTTGLKAQIARTLAGGAIGSMGKANGLGDIEFVLSPQPIQIGNRIWNDLNGDGIQDANENTSPVAGGTTITLRSPGLNGTYGDGDDQTWTTTTDAAGNYYFSALSSADNRKPATWTGVGNSILPGYDYRIETAAVAGFYVTLTDVGTNSVDNIDNDATINGGIAVISFNTSNVNHNFDFGFAPNSTLPVKVTSFTATPNNNTVDLKWKVENQQGIKKYEAEHSSNGRTFTKIDEVMANNQSASSYSVIHNNPISGTNYYRIHITETDGKESFTEIHKVNFAKSGSVTVYPNPVKDILSISVPNSLINKPAFISLITIGGKMIYQKQSKTLSQTEIIKLKNLANGKYILRIETGKAVITKQVEIIR